MKRNILFSSIILLVLLYLAPGITAQVIAKFTLRNVHNPIPSPVHINVDPLTLEPDSMLSLVEIKGKKKIPVPFQIEHGAQRLLWWMVKKEANSRERVFELIRKKAIFQTPVMGVKDQDGALIITDHGHNVLQYNYSTVYPPEGVDSVFRRSGFIHPLWSPAGNVLTRINPWDHRHHFGIWNPWTSVLFQGKEVDFWNLAKKLGTVRFSNFIAKNTGDIFGGFKALQEHVVLDTLNGRDKVAMEEVWDIRTYNVGEGMWLWDFTSLLNCATSDPVLLQKYNYGGFGFRATEQWNKQNSQALTSGGKNRNNGDNTTARWCMIDGKTNTGRSGILFMSYPGNYNFPEPIRIYPENSLYGSGDLFFSFSPTMTTDWLLSPGKNYVLKYRMLVYEGTITAQQAEEVWKSFAFLPEINIQKK